MSQGRLRIAIVSHSYVEAQNQRAADALAEIADVRVIVPNRWPSLLRKRPLRFTPPVDGGAHFTGYRPLMVGRQVALASADLGMKHFDPDAILVEYEPWQLIFWQAAICRSLFARRARI